MTGAVGGGEGLRIAARRVLAAGNRWGAPAMALAVIPGAADPGLLDDVALDRRLRRIDPGLAAAYAAPAPAAVEAVGEAGGHAAVARLAVALLRLLSPVPVRCVVDAGRRPITLHVETMVHRVTFDAIDLAVGIAADPDGDAVRFGRWLADFRRSCDPLLPGSAEAILLDRIAARGLPWRRIDEGPARSYLAIGEGRHRRRLRHTVSEATGHMAGTLTERKDHCTRLLARHRLPVPRLIPVRNPDEAAAAARAIGFPVVVKPADSAGGNAVSVGLTTPDAVRAACASALRHSRRAVVESQLAGRDHRLLVVGGRLVAVTRRIAAHVTGDGSHTIAELVALANARPDRLPPAGLLEPLPLDDEARRLMAVDGWYPDSVPPAGRHIRLRTAANRSQGGSTEDVTAITHPDNAELACQAAALLGLDVAGIDLIAPDISRPVQGSGGGICEVNRSPSLLAHLSAPGAPDVAGAYLDHVLAGAGDLRIPVLAVVGEAAADAVAAAVADRLEAAGIATGLACGARTDAAGVPLAATRPGDPRRVMSLAADPGVAAVVVSVPAAALLAVGFGHDRCDGAVTVGPESPSDRAALDLLSRLGAETASFGPGDGAAATDRLVARSMQLLVCR